LFHRHEGWEHLPSASPAPGTWSVLAACLLPFCLCRILLLQLLPPPWKRAALHLCSALLEAMRPWAIHLTSLSLIFLLCKMGVIFVIFSAFLIDLREELNEVRCAVLSTALGSHTCSKNCAIHSCVGRITIILTDCLLPSPFSYIRCPSTSTRPKRSSVPHASFSLSLMPASLSPKKVLLPPQHRLEGRETCGSVAIFRAQTVREGFLMGVTFDKGKAGHFGPRVPGINPAG
jgi:hypothetical protein